MLKKRVERITCSQPIPMWHNTNGSVLSIRTSESGISCRWSPFSTAHSRAQQQDESPWNRLSAVINTSHYREVTGGPSFFAPGGCDGSLRGGWVVHNARLHFHADAMLLVDGETGAQQCSVAIFVSWCMRVAGRWVEWGYRTSWEIHLPLTSWQDSPQDMSVILSKHKGCL